MKQTLLLALLAGAFAGAGVYPAASAHGVGPLNHIQQSPMLTPILIYLTGSVGVKPNTVIGNGQAHVISDGIQGYLNMAGPGMTGHVC